MDTLILERCKSSIFRDNLKSKAFNLQDNKLRKITITLKKLELSNPLKLKILLVLKQSLLEKPCFHPTMTPYLKIITTSKYNFHKLMSLALNPQSCSIKINEFQLHIFILKSETFLQVCVCEL